MNQEQEDSRHEPEEATGQHSHLEQKNISGEGLTITFNKLSFVFDTGHQIVHKLFKKKTLALLPKSREQNPHLMPKYFYTNSLHNLQLFRKLLQRLFRGVVGAQGQSREP